MNDYQKYHTKTFALFWKLYIMRSFWAKFMEAPCRKDNNYSRGPIPHQLRRKSVIPLRPFVMLGLTFFHFPSHIGPGGTHSAFRTQLSYDFFLLILFGNLSSSIYCISWLSAQNRTLHHLLARYSFGVKGSWLPSLLLGGTQIGLVWRWRNVRYSGP